jgi:hypothetical protein
VIALGDKSFTPSRANPQTSNFDNLSATAGVKFLIPEKERHSQPYLDKAFINESDKLLTSSIYNTPSVHLEINLAGNILPVILHAFELFIPSFEFIIPSVQAL